MVDIGAKLQQLRQSQNLTLRALAAKADVSPSLLSLIENGKANPSVMTLLNIAAALSVPVYVFFPDQGQDGTTDGDIAPDASKSVERVEVLANGEERNSAHENSSNGIRVTGRTQAGPVVSRVSRARIELMGGVVWERLTPGAEQLLEFLEVVYLPGGNSGPAMSRHNGREYGVVIEGELVLELGFERYLLTPGDSVAFDSATPHRLSNPGKSEMRAFWVNVSHD